jgi:hypothetical protein
LMCAVSSGGCNGHCVCLWWPYHVHLLLLPMLLLLVLMRVLLYLRMCPCCDVCSLRLWVQWTSHSPLVARSTGCDTSPQ